MTMTSACKTVICLFTFLVLPSFVFADIRSVTGKPLLDFYTVYGAIDSVKIINELCDIEFPEYKKQNDIAYSLWRSRYKEFIYKIEKYNHEIVKKTSKGNEASYAKQMLDTAHTYEKNKEFMNQMFLDYGETVYRQTCSNYPAYTESEKTDFPNYYKEHLQVFESYWRKQ